MPVNDEAANGMSSGDLDLFGIEASVVGLVVITATTGMVVAVVLRARDNILKLIGTAASLITVAASQYVILPELRASTFTPWRVCGGGIVTISTWCYNHYSQEPWPASNDNIIVDQEVQENEAALSREDVPVLEKESNVNASEFSSMEPTGGSVENNLLQPSPTKILVCAIVVAFATMEVALMRN